jgi:hypothetical protein
MPAIITNEFRLDATNRFVNSIKDGTDTYYVAIGRAQPWDDESNPDIPYENDVTRRDFWDNVYALKKIAPTEVSSVSPGKLWTPQTVYNAYDDNMQPHVGSVDTAPQYFAISNNNNVFMCIKAGPQGSSSDPDAIPLSTGNNPVTAPGDGYTWKYMYTTSVSSTNKFLTTDFVPVTRVPRNADDDGWEYDSADTAAERQAGVQGSALHGAIYRIDLITAGLGYTSTNDVVVTIKGNNAGGTDASAHVTWVSDANGDPLSTNGVYTIQDVVVDEHGSGYENAIVTIINGGANTAATARAVLPPTGGFGFDPRNELRSHYASLNKVFHGQDNLPNTNDFRQIAVIKNPKIPNGSAAIADDYIGCKSMSISQSAAWSDDALIEGTTSTARARVVTYSISDNLLFYTQDVTTGYEDFLSGEDVTVVNSSISAQAIDSLIDAPIKQYSGDMIFLENRQKVSRGSDQLETIRLVLAF